MKKTLTFVYPDGLKTAHSRMYDAGFIHKFQKWGSLRKEECLNFNDKKMKLLLTFREVKFNMDESDSDYEANRFNRILIYISQGMDYVFRI